MVRNISLLLGRKLMTNLDSIFKSRDITLPTKVRSPVPGSSPGESRVIRSGDGVSEEKLFIYLFRNIRLD